MSHILLQTPGTPPSITPAPAIPAGSSASHSCHPARGSQGHRTISSQPELPHTPLPAPLICWERTRAEEERCSSGFSLQVAEQADSHQEDLPRLSSPTCFWETFFWVFLLVSLQPQPTTHLLVLFFAASTCLVAHF